MKNTIIILPVELTYSYRYKERFNGVVIHNKLIRTPEPRTYPYMIIPDFGNYEYSLN